MFSIGLCRFVVISVLFMLCMLRKWFMCDCLFVLV